jgi:hypothetical protein
MSYDTTARIDNTNWQVFTCPTSGPRAILKNDSIIAVWMSEATGDARIMLGTMNVNTMQTGFNAFVDNSPGPFIAQNIPSIAGTGDTLGIVWQDNRNSFTNGIYFSYSVTGPLGLSAAYPVSDTSTNHAFVTPDISYANGTFHIVYQNQTTNSVVYRSVYISGVGMDEPFSVGKKVKIYPNPFSAWAVVEIPDPEHSAYDFLLYDVLGQQVRRINAHDSKVYMERGDLSPGIYQLRVSAGGKMIAVGKMAVK